MTATFDHAVVDAPNIETFYFKPERPLSYTAGQFVELTIAHDNPDSRGAKRWFTLSSSPAKDLLAFTTRFAVERGSSYKNALRALKAGDAVTISDPMGDFVLPKLIQTPLVFIAGGIGVTPFVSMLQWLAETGESRPIKMMVGVNNESEIVFQDIYDDAHQHVTVVVDKPSPSWGGERGRVTAELVLGVEEPNDDTLIYISGPEQMVEKLTIDLRAKGVDKHRIVGDYFPGYPAE